MPDRRQPNETSKPVTSSQQASSLPLDSQDLDTYGSNRLWSALTRAVPPTSGTLVGFTTTSFVGLKVLDVFAHTASIFSKASFLTPLLSAQSALTVGTREPIRRTHFADRLYVKTPQTILSRLSSYVIPLTTNPQDTRRLNGLNQELVYWHADNDKPKRPIPGPKPCETVLAQ